MKTEIAHACNDAMLIVHFVKPAALQGLCDTFAKLEPVSEPNAGAKWCVPDWLITLMDSAGRYSDNDRITNGETDR